MGKISKASDIFKWGWRFLVLLTEGLTILEGLGLLQGTLRLRILRYNIKNLFF